MIKKFPVDRLRPMSRSDDNSLSKAISQKTDGKKIIQQRVNTLIQKKKKIISKW